MTASTATPQFYTADDVRALLVDDFAARGINAAVEINEWDPEAQRGEPRVVISYDRGEITEPAGHYQPGAIWSNPGGSTDLSRALLDVGQGFILRIHSPSMTGSSEPAADGARRATDQLVRQTLRALRRSLASPFRRAGSLEWPTKDDDDVKGYQGFVYGSLCRVRIEFAAPVLDDAVAYQAPVTEMGVELDVSFDLGVTFNQSDTFTETVPS
jgi:hypothetical protein